ncbi:MAG: hypothetical protein ABWX60_09240 [Aeromicrobium sp.]
MRITWVVPFLLAVALLGGCGGGSSHEAGGGDSEPSAGATDAGPRDAEQALRRYLLAADAGDCAAVKESVLVPEDVECGDVSDQKGQWSADGTDLATVPMAPEVFDDSATVAVQWPDGPEDSFDLQLDDGTWFVLAADTGDGV